MVRSIGPEIPIEVIGYIIDILACKDRALEDPNDDIVLPDPILACSLTCKSLLSLCRRHIFKYITIDIDKFDNICQLFESAPQDGIYVRNVYFALRWVSEPLTTGRQEKMLQVIDRLTAVETLDLWHKYDYSITYDWDTDILPGMKEIFTRLIQLPTLTSLALMDISIENIPSYVLTNLSRRLLRLNVQDSTFAFADPEDEELAPEMPVTMLGPIRLEQCSIDPTSSEATSNLLNKKDSSGSPVFDLKNLKHLNLDSLDMRIQEPIIRQLLVLAEEIETMRIFEEIEYPVDKDEDQLGQLAETIISCGKIPTRMIILHASAIPDGLYILFDDPKITIAMQSVVINIERSSDVTPKWLEDDDREFEDFFTDRIRWPHLEKLEINILIMPWSMKPGVRWISDVEKRWYSILQIYCPILSSGEVIPFSSSIMTRIPRKERRIYPDIYEDFIISSFEYTSASLT